MKRQGRMWAMALTVVAGCAQPLDNAAGGATLPITVLASQGQCGGLSRPTVRWIADAGEWREVYAQINRQWLDPPPPPAVDFSRAGVLLIAMGQQSTAGYGLRLADDVAALRDGVLTIRVDWREPPPGRRQAQVMTNPCLLATVPAVDFTWIRVVDREGRMRLEGKR